MTSPHPTRARAASPAELDRLDSGRRPARAAVLAVLVGALLGALLGGLFGASRSPAVTASLALSVQPDATVEPGTQDSTLDAPAYIQGQLVTLNGAQLAQTVRTRLHLTDTPSITATEVGQTYVVQVDATAGTAAEATSVANAAGAAYDALRTDRLRGTLTQSLTAIQTQVAALAAELRKAAGPNGAVTPAQTALQTEYQRLLSLQDSTNVALGSLDGLVSVQSPAHAAAASISPTAKYTAVGALLGALAGLTLLILARRLRPGLGSAADIAALGVPILLPTLPRARRRRAAGAARWRSTAARLLAARLATPPHATVGAAPNPAGSAGITGPNPVIVVTGATGGVGTSYAAAALACGLTGRTPVLLVLAGRGDAARAGRGDADAGPGTDVVPSAVDDVWLLPVGSLVNTVGARRASGRAIADRVQRASTAGWTVVVDAAPLDESDVALELLALPYCTATLVVGLGLSRPDEVLSAAELLETRSDAFVGVLVNDAPGSLRRRLDAGRATVAARPGALELNVAADGAQVATPTLDNVPWQRRRPQPARTRAAARPERQPAEGPAQDDGFFAPYPIDEQPATGGADAVDTAPDANGLDANGLDANGLDANGLDANGLDENGDDDAGRHAHRPETPLDPGEDWSHRQLVRSGRGVR